VWLPEKWQGCSEAGPGSSRFLAGSVNKTKGESQRLRRRYRSLGGTKSELRSDGGGKPEVNSEEGTARAGNVALIKETVLVTAERISQNHQEALVS
jgi:hypothetical protein